MSQLKTHLLAEDPSIVLIGNNTILRSQVIKMLQDQNLQVVVVDVEEILEGKVNLNIFDSVYKTIWLHENNADKTDNYLGILSIIREIKIPVIIVATLISNVAEHNSDLLQGWKERSRKQTQFIVDCNYHLSKASFIFGSDVISKDSLGTSLEFLLQNVRKRVVVNPDVSLGIIDSGLFVESLKEYLFKPGKQSSVLIRGEIIDSSKVIGSIKKLYDSYYNANLEVVDDSVKINSLVPFSVKEIIIHQDIKILIARIVKSLSPPSEPEKSDIISKPDENLKNQIVEKIPPSEGFSTKILITNKIVHERRIEETTGIESLDSRMIDSRIPDFRMPDSKKLDFRRPLQEKLLTKTPLVKTLLIETPLTETPLTKTPLVKTLLIETPLTETPPEKKLPVVSETLVVGEIISLTRVPSPPKIDVDNEIQRIFQTTRTETKVGRIRKIAKDTNKITKKSGRKRIFFIGGIGAAGAAIGIIFLAVIFYVSQTILRKELVAFISRGIVDQETVLIEDEGLKRITSFVGLQTNAYGSVIETNLISDSASMVEISENLQLIPQMLLEVDEASKNLFLQIIAGDSNKTTEFAQILDDKAQLAYEKLSGIQASFNLIDFDINSENREIIITNYENKLREIRNEIAIQQQLQPILASLTGEKSKKTYAVIFQNNQELRPTGGFIQAVALLNFDQGILVSHSVYSVYDLDSKLSGSIIPPSDVTNYLGEEKWYLRDSNWNPDFPTASAQIGWFINKSLGVDVDGVIALNLFSARDILEVTGPVDLPEYNEVLTHKNLLERMEFHSEVVLVSSPDSIDYSVAVLKKLIEKITNLNREKVPALFSSLEHSIVDNQISISVTEKSDQLVLHSLGWTGGLSKPNCPTQLSLVDCKVDVLSQVEANIGINKANYYLDRSIVHKVVLDREKAVHTREITFMNNAKSNSWPKGTYKSYQRFYIDKDVILDKVLINGSALIEEQISQKEVNGFKEIGIRVDVPIQKQVVVELDYTTPHNFENGFSYVFFNRKQPGTSGDLLKVSIKYADDMEPVLIAPAAQVSNKTITFNSGFENSLFSVEFQ